MSTANLQQWWLSQQVQTRQRHWVVFVLLLLTVITSAITVVFTTFTSRRLLNELQDAVQEQNRLQVEWGQLLLEQGSLVAQGQIEEIAITQLGMQVPAMDKVVVFTSE
jgi:cell division protein FtsL